MNNKLSIIIPCYNCQETLKEAVVSVYRQELTIPFELILVNDASTDDTQKVIKALAQKYPNLYYYRHDTNLGGGATRNTAVEKATGNIIFCLDSDDLLGDSTLNKMINFLLAKNCDGVGISTSIKFKGKNRQNIAFTSHFGYVGEKIPWQSLLQQEGNPLCPLYSTFMLTKKAFFIAGGYPTEHGFDTQGFAWRFLANGLVAYTCPDAIYWHRVDFHKSYYLREYENGKINHNWFKISEEFIYLFSPETQNFILNYDLNHSEKHLIDELKSQNKIFRLNWPEFIKSGTRDFYQKEIETNKQTGAIDYYWLGAKKMAENNQTEALFYLTKAWEQGMRNDHLYQKLLAVGFPFNEIERQKAELAVDRLLAYQKHGSALSLSLRIWQKLIKLFKSIYG